MKKSIFLVLFLLVAVVAIVMFLSNPTKVSTVFYENKVEGSPIFNILSNSNTEVYLLRNVAGGYSTGKAYILREGGKLYIYITTPMGSPSQTGAKWEAWFTKRQHADEYLSLGIMTPVITGGHMLLYISEDEHTNYDYIVVSSDVVHDDSPEYHVLEGSHLGNDSYQIE